MMNNQDQTTKDLAETEVSFTDYVSVVLDIFEQ